jgi:hypothetical protein
LTDFDENTLPRRLRFRICFSIAIIGACPNENFVSRDLAISDYSDRLLDVAIVVGLPADPEGLRQAFYKHHGGAKHAANAAWHRAVKESGLLLMDGKLEGVMPMEGGNFAAHQGTSGICAQCAVNGVPYCWALKSVIPARASFSGSDDDTITIGDVGALELLSMRPGFTKPYADRREREWSRMCGPAWQ